MALYKTYVTKPLELERDWWIVDAKGQTLGRLASLIAPILRGKHKPVFVPNQDVGDYVIVINCEQIAVTGNKLDEKMYYKFSGYPGGLSEINLRDQLRKFPDRPIIAAVHGTPHRRGRGPPGPRVRKLRPVSSRAARCARSRAGRAARAGCRVAPGPG